MIVLGIDPGETTGWCSYDPVLKRVIASGQFERDRMPSDVQDRCLAASAVVIEKPVAHGPTRPQVVECAWIAGNLNSSMCEAIQMDQLTRMQVKQALTAATSGEVRVVNDATAWAAVRLLHGDGCDKKGGRIHGVKSHERAALALVVAYCNPKPA